MRSHNAGPRRQRVILYDVPEPDASVDSWGQPSQTPTMIGTFWALVRPLKGDEQLNVRQIWPLATHQIELNWLGSSIPVSADNPGNGTVGYIMPQMKFKLQKDNRIFNVVNAINVDEANFMWQIIAEEKIGATS